MKKLLALVLVLCMGIPMVAFAKEAGLNVTACIASEPETIDPSLISSVDGSTYTQHAFEGLMKYAKIDTLASESEDVYLCDITYGQAESYEVSEDGLTWTFKLRDDIFWSDGEPVTAQDFVYSWQRVTDPANASDYGYILTGVVTNATAIQNGEMDPSELGVKALDDKTLEVTLEANTPYFVSLCSFAALVPLRQDVIEKFGAEWTDPANVVTNGPFVYSEWVHDSYIKMVPNEQYYNRDAVGPESITWYLSDSQTAMKAAFDAGEYMFFDDLPTDQIQPMVEAGDAFIGDQICTYYLYLSCDNIPDWRVRAAISLAIDRENIVENVTQGGQTPATGYVAAGILNSSHEEWTSAVGEPLYDVLAEMYPDADLSIYAGRCELAQQLLEEAVADGYNADATIEYQFNTSESHKAIAEAVQSDVASVLGLNVVLANSEWQTYTNNLSEGKFGIARLGWSADYNDAVTYVDMFVTGGSYNYSNWSNPEYDALIAEIKTMPGGAERDAKMVEAERMIFGEDGFCITPLYFYSQPYALGEGITEALWTPLGYFIFTYATAK